MSQSKFIIIGVLLFWAGFVSAISFMEAWLKFRAKGVTLPIALRIGKKVFTALNRMEWMFFFLYIVFGLFQFKIRFEVVTLLTILILVILIIQTVYLLPQLDKRANLLIEGESIEKSFLHIYYVSMEVIKVWLLLLLSYQLSKLFITLPSQAICP